MRYVCEECVDNRPCVLEFDDDNDNDNGVFVPKVCPFEGGAVPKWVCVHKNVKLPGCLNQENYEANCHNFKDA